MNKEEHNLKSKQYYQDHKEECKRKARERSRRRRLEAPDDVRERDRLAMRTWRLNCKVITLSNYGRDGSPVCVRCGFSDIRALSIDHINGRGRSDRRDRGCGGSIYSRLIKEDFPSGFQTLCMNCQWIKRFENNEQR